MMLYHPSLEISTQPRQPRLSLTKFKLILSSRNPSCAHLNSHSQHLSALLLGRKPSISPHDTSPAPTGPPPAMTSLPAPDPDCPFCTISTTYPPSASQKPDLSSQLTTPPAFLVLHSCPLCIAFLDIMPLSPGHLLLTTRAHHEKVSEVTDDEARELGRWLRVLSRVLARVTGVWDWNIVQNNGLYSKPKKPKNGDK